MRNSVSGISALFVLLSSLCLAAPKPAVVPGPGKWTLQAKFLHPQQIVVQTSPNGRKERFWYVILSVVNNTHKDVNFYHQCDLMTDTFQVLPAGKGVPPEVFKHIKARYKEVYPFLEELGQTDHRLLQGEDNARDIAIIWSDFDPKAQSVKLFLTGLSNETAVIEHPVAKNESGNPAKVYLRKTIELSYEIKGDSVLRSDADMVYKGKRWIMR